MCWYCRCQDFSALHDAPDVLVTVQALAKELQVSETWVRKRAEKLGGAKVDGVWRFSYPNAMVWGFRMIEGSDRVRSVISVCGKCGGKEVTRKGGLGYVFIDGDHLPGMCHGEM